MPDYIVRITTTQPALRGANGLPADAEPVVTERLVRAKNQAQALGHVTDSIITVELAETEDIIRCAQAGVTLETAAQ